jgi:bloom syndrome protein
MDLISSKLNVFGINNLRPFQEKVVKAYLDKKNILVFVMTGGGKSLCYQLPSILDNKLVVVISPLKSLMEDQVNDLQRMNIESCVFSGDQSYQEKQTIFNNLVKDEIPYNIIYTNPETLQYNHNFYDILEKINKKKKLGMIVFDEAHCMSLWGHDFRPSYLEMKELKNKIKGVPFMALTASATKRVEEEIKKILNFDDDTVYIKESFRRENLNIKIIHSKGQETYKNIEHKVKNEYKNQSGIIYCHSRKKCEKLYEYLMEQNIKTEYYHAGLDFKTRKEIQEKWKNNKVLIVIATIAFGMGINKKDVRFVIHCNIPSSIENYYQEIGRGGRDGKKTDCILYYNYCDKILQQKLIESGNDKKDKDYYYHKLNKLNQMVSFIENISDCRHFLLTNYFGEIDNFKCHDFCDNCKNNQNILKIDITEVCKVIFKIIVSNDVSRSRIKNFLKGKKEINQFKLDNHVNDNIFDRILIYLISNKYIKETISLTNNNLWYEKLYLYKKSKRIFDNKNKKIFIDIVKVNTISKYFKNVTKEEDKIEINQEIYKKLLEKRNEIAKKKALPSYCVLNNKVLESISKYQPNNFEELLKIKGIGKEKINQYGDMILNIVNV